MADEYGSRTLKNGDSGEDVYELQVRLVAFAAKDKPVPCDGTFDANTEAALKRFCKLFALPEQAAADSRVYSALQDWAREMKPTMQAFLDGYKCRCQAATGSTLTKMNDFWTAHVKGKLPLLSGGSADGPTCTGFGNGLKEVALGEKDPPWTYAGKKAQPENPGISKTLFWAVMGLLKIYETDEKVPKIDVHNGYRCNRDYLRVKYTVNNTAAMGNHVGCAVDFHLVAPSGVSARSYTQAHLAAYSQGAVKHCNNIRDDLQTFGVAETLQATPRNRLRLEPRNLATTWVHLDSTVYEKQVYVRTVEEAMSPEFTPGFYALPLDVGHGIELTAQTVTGVYRHIEKEFAGGYFPVGGNTVWHGGVHLRHARSPDVHACMGGTLIAARLPDDPAKADGHYGSHNFILLQHTRETKTFFSLYMHLGRLPLRAGHDALKRFRWIEKAGGQQLLDKLRGGDVVKVGCEVKGGDPLWVVGEYGSVLSRAQLLHWEIFSAENLLDAPPPADPPLEGATGWSTDNRILVQAIARIGEGHAYVDDAVKFVVTHCSFKDAPEDQYKPVRWLIESMDKAFSKQFDDQGLKLELKIPAELAGKTIRVWAFMHAKSDKVALDVRVAPGKRQKWIVAEDRDGNFNVDSDTILRLFPRDVVESDDLLSTNELVAFYRNNPKEAVEKLRFAVCKFTSEWGVSNLDAAVNALKGRGFFSYGLKEKLAPYMFWKEARSAGVELPASPLTWHYHPVKLLETFCPAAAPAPEPKPAPVAASPSGWTVTSQVVENEARAMAKLHIWKRALKKGIKKEKAKAAALRQVSNAEISEIQTWVTKYEEHEKWRVSKAGNEPTDPGPQPAKATTLAGTDAPSDTHEKPTEYEVTSPDGMKFKYEDHVYAEYTIFDDGVGDAGTLGGLAKMTSVFQGAGIQAPDAQTAQKVLAVVSAHEGKLDSINTYDTGYISAGFIQFAAMHDGTGSLASVLTDMKTAAPATFKTYFSDLGIDVTGGAISATDPETKAVSQGSAAMALIRKEKRLTAVFQYASRKCDEYNHAQARLAYKRYYLPDKTFTVKVKASDPDHPGQTKTITLTGRYGDVLRSQAGKVACVDRAVQFGENKTPDGQSGGAPDTFARACQSVVTKHHLIDPTVADMANYEIEIVKALKNRHEVLGDSSLTQPSPVSEA